MRVKVKVDTVAGLRKISKRLDEAILRGMRNARTKIMSDVYDRTPIRTGDLWSGWKPTIYGGSLTFKNEVPHAFVVEEGKFTWHYDTSEEHPHPLTIKNDSGIWSKKAVGGMVTPLVESGKVESVIIEEVKREISKLSD